MSTLNLQKPQEASVDEGFEQVSSILCGEKRQKQISYISSKTINNLRQRQEAQKENI